MGKNAELTRALKALEVAGLTLDGSTVLTDRELSKFPEFTVGGSRIHHVRQAATEAGLSVARGDVAIWRVSVGVRGGVVAGVVSAKTAAAANALFLQYWNEDWGPTPTSGEVTVNAGIQESVLEIGMF